MTVRSLVNGFPDCPPPGWQRLPFWAVARRKKSTGWPDEELLSVYLGRGVIRHSEASDYTHAPSEDLSSYQLVDPGDAVFNNQQAFRGCVGVSTFRGITSPAYLVYSFSSEVLPAYASYLLTDPLMVGQYGQVSRGVGTIQRQVSPDELRKVSLVLPPLTAQRTIAEHLATETDRIDSLIEKKRRMVDYLIERRRAVIHGKLEGPESGSRGSSSKEGLETRLRFLLKERDQRGNEGENVLSVYRDLGVIPKDSRTDNFNRTPEDLSGYKLVMPGDVVVNKMKAWQGSVAVSPYRGIVSGDYLVCEVIGQVELRFLHYLLRSPRLIGEYGMRSSGIRPSQWRLYWDDFAHIRVTLPATSTQIAVGDELDGAIRWGDELKSKLDEQIDLLREHRGTLITAAITGRLSVPGVAA